MRQEKAPPRVRALPGDVATGRQPAHWHRDECLLQLFQRCRSLLGDRGRCPAVATARLFPEGVSSPAATLRTSTAEVASERPGP